MGPRAGLDRCEKSRPPPGFFFLNVETFIGSQYNRYNGTLLFAGTMLRYWLDGCIATTGNCLRIVLVVRFRSVLQFGSGGSVSWLAILVYSFWVECLIR